LPISPVLNAKKTLEYFPNNAKKNNFNKRIDVDSGFGD